MPWKEVSVMDQRWEFVRFGAVGGGQPARALQAFRDERGDGL